MISMNLDTSKPRLVSLDIFRGVTIGAMIVVNNLIVWTDSPRFKHFFHAEWNGCTMADLIYPFFIFIVGVTAVFSLSRRLKTGESRLQLYRHIFTRTNILFFLGLVTGSWFIVGWLFQAICPPTLTRESIWAIFLSPPANTDFWFYSLENLRIMGILQRLALVYLAVAILLIHTRWRVQALVAGGLLLLYWGLMSLPGYALLPGEDLGTYVDLAVLGEAHLWSTWDPESLLGTLPAIATGLAGALTGHWLASDRDGRTKLLGLLLCGFLGIILGKVWGLVFPINKFLWTSSYAVYTAGFALVFLGFWFWLIDLRQVRAVWVSPAIWLGMNPLFAYCGSQILFIALQILYIGRPPHHTHLITLISNALFGQNWDVIGQTAWHAPHWPGLLWALLCLTFWTSLTGLLYRQRIFLKV
jgi:predicted acyltransferase